MTAEKLKIEKNAYGKVIRMMAHEVNNSIGPINSIISSVMNYGNKLAPQEQEDFQHALQIAKDRNQKLNRFMRNFADVVKLPLPNKKEQDLGLFLEEVTRFMQPAVGDKTIKIEFEKPTSPIFAKFDLQQMEQVLINVIKNAMEAVEENGVIKVEIQNNPLAIRVFDNGIGIPADKAEKLFSPFYSTKTEGQGIGLTLTREVLLNHGFDFSLKTQADGWTVFEIKIQQAV